MIEAVLAPFRSARRLEMSTVCRRFEDEAEFKNPNVVKAVVNRDGYALYFSRAPVPFHRATGNAGIPASAFKHIGLYGYRRATLLRLAALAPTPLEDLESLEQLRALEHGIRIRVVETPFDSIGVDTEADVARVRAILSSAAQEGLSGVPSVLAGHHAKP
jgi:3-deoxy-manno-octulosonate cytidylyltransferase (CMP-KDO synthetase)